MCLRYIPLPIKEATVFMYRLIKKKKKDRTLEEKELFAFDC